MLINRFRSSFNRTVVIVNISRIKELQPGAHGEYVITLDSGVRLQSGRTYSEKLKTMSANPF